MYPIPNQQLYRRMGLEFNPQIEEELRRIENEQKEKFVNDGLSLSVAGEKASNTDALRRATLHGLFVSGQSELDVLRHVKSVKIIKTKEKQQ